MLPLLLLLLLTENAAAAAAATPRSGLPVFDAAAGATGSMSALERAAHPPDSVLVMQLKQPQCRENCAEKVRFENEPPTIRAWCLCAISKEWRGVRRRSNAERGVTLAEHYIAY